MNRLAELASIILCTCFPMMPRLVKLIADRRAKSKSRSYSASPLGQALKRIATIVGKDYSSSGTGSASSHAAEETTRLKRPHEQWEGGESMISGSRKATARSEDIEAAMLDLNVQHFSDVLEQRLDIDFTVPRFSYPQ